MKKIYISDKIKNNFPKLFWIVGFIFFISVFLNERAPGWVLFISMISLIFFQVIAGYALGMNWKPWYYREEKPLKYWIVIGIQVIFIICFYLYIFKAWLTV